MRPASDVHEVFRLARQGLTQVEIAAAVGVGQTTVSRWLRGGDGVLESPMRRRGDRSQCPTNCARRNAVPAEDYAYLLGQYLGDGSIAHTRRGVYRFFLACCAAYPDIIDECRRSIRAVLPVNVVGQRSRSGMVELNCYSTHWPCLFPQHGPGKKHSRRIALEPWQSHIALHCHPDRLLRGLVHSDGCRCINHVTGRNGSRYAYPRYMFTNRSADIRQLFVDACGQLGIESRQMNHDTISVARRDDVARLDEFIGAKS
jgi:hypothetical protein